MVFKIGLSSYNLRVLYYIKKQLGKGSIYVESNKNDAHFRIRDRKVLKEVIFPIFDKYPLLTTKHFYYTRFKKIYNILEDSKLSRIEKNNLIDTILATQPESSYISPAFYGPLIDANQAKNIISKAWLVGFIEAEGSFYLVSKDKTRIVHGFGISQKLDKIVLESIKLVLHIPTKVVYKSARSAYMLDTTNSRAIQNIIEYFHKTMIGMKAVEFKIWSKAYNNKGNYKKLYGIREQLRSLRSIRPDNSLWSSHI